MKAKVFGVVARVMDVPIDQISEATGPDDLATWDSLQHMNLIFALEDELGMELSDLEIVRLRNFGDILSTVTGRLAARDDDLSTRPES